MNDVGARRADAARESGGISDSPIYGAALDLLGAAGGSGRVLDFGAGRGLFAREICRLPRVNSVTAADLLEYSDRASHGALRWVWADLNEPMPFADEAFDVIVALEIIEHLENPRFVAREWYRLLDAGGQLLVSTPNNESWRSILSLLVRGHFIAYSPENYPAHISPLLRVDLRRLLAEAGFVDVRFSFTDHGVLPKLTSVTWQRASRGRLRGVRYSDNILCMARKPGKNETRS